jgi:hypothetical protein
MTLEIPQYDGVAELSAYPLDWHPSVDKVRTHSSFARDAIRVEYSTSQAIYGMAYKRATNDETIGVAHYMDSRIMVDRRKVLVRAASLILNCTALLGTFSTAQPAYFRKSALRILDEATVTNVHDLHADNPVMLASSTLGVVDVRIQRLQS